LPQKPCPAAPEVCSSQQLLQQGLPCHCCCSPLPPVRALLVWTLKQQWQQAHLAALLLLLVHLPVRCLMACAWGALVQKGSVLPQA